MATEGELPQQARKNDSVNRNGLVFGILTLLTHIIACFMFGFYFVIPASSSTSTTVDPNIFSPIFNAFAHGLLVIVGFGLLFSYLKKMVWSGIGFALLICALCFEFYFMFNAFWVKADVLDGSQTFFSSDDKTFNLYLSVQNQPDNQRYNSTVTGAFRCALAILIAFSSILGRAGPLEAWLISFIGTLGYQLNRQIIENFSFDVGGTFSIFLYGSFMGVTIGFLRSFREKQGAETQKHSNYTANRFSASFALIGTLIIWIFLPVLVFDDADLTISQNGLYTGPQTVMFALASSTVAAIMMSLLFNGGRIGIRDLIYGSLAGGISSASASYYITNPVYGILFGFISGVLQVILLNVVEKKVANNSKIINTYTFTLFGIQGFLGCIFAAAWQAVAIGYANDFQYNFDLTNEPAVFAFADGLISIGMGIGFGLLAGILVLCVGGHQRKDHFTDETYWLPTDGIRYIIDVEPEEEKMVVVEHSKIKRRFAYL